MSLRVVGAFSEPKFVIRDDDSALIHPLFPVNSGAEPEFQWLIHRALERYWTGKFILFTNRTTTDQPTTLLFE